MMINHNTRLNMVIGHPLDHTQSPLLHNAIYETQDLNSVLLAFPHSKIKSLIQTIKTLAVELTAVTMPFKKDVLKYLDHCSPEVDKLHAANTVIFRNNELWGYNTDIDGIEYALSNTSLVNKNVLVIGAGGAASAVAYVMQKSQSNLYWFNRTRKKALSLASIFGGEVLNNKQIIKAPIDIIINTTPIGMHPHIHDSPLPNYHFKPNQTVFDLVYNPVNTKLLQQAAHHGAKIISGIEMFIGQGIRQVELWSGKKISIENISNNIKKMLIDHQELARG